MNLANEKPVRQLQDVRQLTKDEIAVGQRLPWVRYNAKLFKDLRCPFCGAFGCHGC